MDEEQKPVLSVVVPVYNCEKYLSETLDSLINQTLKDIEIICVNDGSCDNSIKILNEYAKKSSKIKIIDKENEGVSCARNAGMAQAQGEFITFVDADDILDLDAYEIALEKTNNVDIVCFGIRVFGDSWMNMRESDNRYYKIKREGFVSLTDEIRSETDVSCCNKIFRMEIIKKNEISYPQGLHYEDANFYWKYILNCKNAYMINKYLYHYRRHNNSIMSHTFEGAPYALDHLYVAKDLYDYLISQNIFDKNLDIFEKVFESFTFFSYHHVFEDKKTDALKKAQEYAKIMFKNKKHTKFISNLIKGRWDKLFEAKLNFLQKIFSLKNVKNHKLLVILGIRIKFRRRKKNC